MKPYNQHEYNRLCAEFLGWESLSPKTKYCYWKYPEEKSFTFKLGSPVHSNNLIFHSDWNWIIEVVEKIENLRGVTVETNNNWVGEFTIVIRCGGYSGTYYKSINKPRVSHGQDFRTKKEAVVESIWQFLNWYNEQK